MIAACISLWRQAINLLEENMNIYLHDLEFAKYFLNRAQITNQKEND